MVCKFCNTSIHDNSKYCCICGSKIDNTKNDNENNYELSKRENLSNKKSSIVANEIIANLKMFGWAFMVVLAYMIVFYCCHIKDIKPIGEDSSWGDSCYDPSFIHNGFEIYWELEYAKSIRVEFDSRVRNWKNWEWLKNNLFPNMSKSEIQKSLLPNISESKIQEYQMAASTIEFMRPENAFAFANELGQAIGYSEAQFKRAEDSAKQIVNENKRLLYEDLSLNRKSCFEEDCTKNIFWSAIFSIVFFVGGRYIRLLWKWVIANKS